MEKLLFVIHVIASYTTWIVITRIIYNRIKNKLIYLYFPILLYSVPLIAHDIDVILRVFGLICLLSASVLNMLRKGGKNFLETIFIPLPVIINLAYYVLMVT